MKSPASIVVNSPTDPNPPDLGGAGAAMRGAQIPVLASGADTRLNLLGQSREQLAEYFAALGEKRFRVDQLLKWIHQRKVLDFSLMTDLGKSLRAHLSEVATLELPELVEEQASRDGTRKWLIRVAGGNCIETVFIPEPDRGTLCVSSQVGCALNCSFCSTAKQGFNRNLSAAEIIGQLWIAQTQLAKLPEPTSANAAAIQTSRISNVVLMGMGEPLLNFENVVPALSLMLEDCAYGLGRRRVTLSTAGMAPMLDKLAQRAPVALAVSLHAPNDALRDQLVPINRSYPIKTLLAACKRYVRHDPKQSITFEYVMLDGVNDSDDNAKQLAKLLADVPAKVNLIPFNPFEGSGYKRSPPARINAFREILMRHRIITITRKTRGDDIDAACGQLAGKVTPRSARVARRRGLSAESSDLTDTTAVR